VSLRHYLKNQKEKYFVKNHMKTHFKIIGESILKHSNKFLSFTFLITTLRILFNIVLKYKERELLL